MRHDGKKEVDEITVHVSEEALEKRPLYSFSCNKEVTRRTFIFAVFFVIAALLVLVFYREIRVVLLCLFMSAVFSWFTWQDKNKRVDIYEDKIVQDIGSGRFYKHQEILWSDVSALRETTSILAAANTFYLSDKEMRKRIVIDSTLSDYISLMRYCRDNVMDLDIYIRNPKIMMAIDNAPSKNSAYN